MDSGRMGTRTTCFAVTAVSRSGGVHRRLGHRSPPRISPRMSAGGRPPHQVARAWRKAAALIFLATPKAAYASAGQHIAETLRAKGIPDLLVLAAISAMPVVELRGGVPVGFWMQMSPLYVYVCCVLGNMLPVLPLLLALRSPVVRRWLAPAIERATKLSKTFGDDRKRLIALALFVGVPFPGTGAWTGTMIAYVLSMGVVPAFLSILAGVLLSGIIMTALCSLGLVGGVVAGTLMLAVGFASMFTGPPRNPPADVEEGAAGSQQ